MKNLSKNRTIAYVLRRIGIDPFQYGLILDLFHKLSERQEYEVGNASLSLWIAVGMATLLSGVANLLFAFVIKPPLRSFILGNFLFTTFLLATILAMEAINTFLNPVEASVLAHQPIRNSSYFAAKLTYLAVVAGYVVFPINIIPSLVGLNLSDASWFHPVTYLASAYLLGLFVALMACGIIGLLFWVLPASRVRNAVLWFQVGFFISVQAGGRLLEAVGKMSNRVNVTASPALPLNWFAALASPALGIKNLATWPAAASMIGCAAFIAFGVRSLSNGYLTRVHTLLRSGPSRRRSRSGLLGSLVRMVTGKPAGRGGLSFVYAMARTDWQFRRTVYPVLFQVLVLPVIVIARGGGLGTSPFQVGDPTPAQLLPHLTGLLGFLFCFGITSSNQHRAAWIFLTFPPDSIRAFVRGIYCSLWILLNVLSVLLWPFFAYRWGIGDAMLFTVYSLAVGSFYLSVELFAINGLPFGSPPESLKGSLTGPLAIAGLIGAVILSVIQVFFIFQSRLLTAGAVVAFAGAAYLVAKTSLKYVEVNVLHNLHRIATGETGMFKEIG